MNKNTKTLVEVMGEDVKLAELVQRDEFLQVVNTEPPKNWVKDHPFAKGVKYLPIEKVELLLTRIFQQWKVEVLREGQLAQSLYVTVRLHYLDPITSEWMWQDGVGAAPLKTNKGESAANLSAILNDAVKTGLPAAESFAVKDAAEKIGKLFGKDLNRKDVMDFSPTYATQQGKIRATKQKKKILEDLENESN